MLLAERGGLQLKNICGVLNPKPISIFLHMPLTPSHGASR